MARARRRRRNPRLRPEMIRRSHAVAPFGVGSIVDLPSESIMPLAIDFWPENFGIPIFDERLERRLNVMQFRMIPSHSDNGNVGVPCIHFPRWLFCPRCRGLRPVDKWRDDFERAHSQPFSVPECYTCRSKLVPARFIVACERGHIDDFPWVEWTHRGYGVCSNPELQIFTTGATVSLRGIKVKCTTCSAENTMEDSFSEGIHTKCSGNMPWLRKREDCPNQPRTLQRGASNTYFPLVVGSIVLPNDAPTLDRAIKESDWWSIVSSESDSDDVRSVATNHLAKSLGRNIDEIEQALDRLLGTRTEKERISETAYRYQEYEVFAGIGGFQELRTRDLRLEIVSGGSYGIKHIKSVTLVHRLREVRALVAFSRLRPLDRHKVPDEDSTTGNTRAIFVRGQDKNRNWLPAVEHTGEGVFISFDEAALAEWAANPRVAERVHSLHERYNSMVAERGLSPREITPQFVFLHTFAHLLIRQLTFEAGYGSASLRERIYCNSTPGEPSMAGILVYTASSDSDGTLGGLVRLGSPDFLPRIIRKIKDTAYWCSSDPLCAESKGQGLDSLNLAACYACTLVPETSCEEANRLLDRVLVVGQPDLPDRGFLGQMLS